MEEKHLFLIAKRRWNNETQRPETYGHCGLGVTLTLDTTAHHYSLQCRKLWGQDPTWNDLIAALYWGDNNIGEPTEAYGQMCHKTLTTPWRVDCHVRSSGAKEYRVLVQDEVAREFGGHGKCVAKVHISCAGKLNKDIPFLSAWGFYILVHSILSFSWEEIEEIYAGDPPREITPLPESAWMAPGASPWERSETAK